jgi:hypothetical protein
LIIKQISAAKSKVLKYLDDIEKKLITEVGSVQEKNEEKIIHRICHSAHSVHSFSSQSEQYFSATSLLFFSEHGSQIASMMDLQVVTFRLCFKGRQKFIFTLRYVKRTR